MEGALAAVIEMSIALSALSVVGALLAWGSLRQTVFVFWALSWASLGARLAFDLARITAGDVP